MKVFRRPYFDKSGERRLCETWTVRFRVGGKRHLVHTGLRDKRAAEVKAGEIIRRAEMRAAGIAEPFEEDLERKIARHLDDFEKTLRARGVVEKYVKDRMKCLRAFVEATRVETLRDVDLIRASGWISELRGTGLSARSVNTRYQALKQFGLWLVRTRRIGYDPLAGLAPLNEAADRRHVRRALTPEEAQRLLDAARRRPLDLATKERVRKGVTPEERLRLMRIGETRALIYQIALWSGLRKGEISRLRWCDVGLDERRVTVTAASAKARRVQTVEIPDGLVEALRAAKPADAKPMDAVIPPKSMPNSITFDADLESAGIPKLDAEERVVDFHAMRTTYVTWLQASGAHPAVAQSLARHASVETTLKHYTDLRLMGTRAAVNRLPSLSDGSAVTSASAATAP